MGTLGLVQHQAIAALSLRGVPGVVGAAQHRILRVIAHQQCNADRCRKAQIARQLGRRRFAHGAAKAIGNQRRLISACAWQHRNEFFAAVTCQRIDFTKAGAHALAGDFQCLITHRMTKLVVKEPCRRANSCVSPGDSAGGIRFPAATDSATSTARFTPLRMELLKFNHGGVGTSHDRQDARHQLALTNRQSRVEITLPRRLGLFSAGHHHAQAIRRGQLAIGDFF